MKALIIPEHGGIEVLRYSTDFPLPKPRPGETLVRVMASGVNQIDRIVRMGYPGIATPLPHVCGGDIAGVVERAAADGSGPQAGTRVLAWPLVPCLGCSLCLAHKENLCINWQYFGLHRHGGYSEYVAVPGANLLELPQGLSFDDSVGLCVAGMTAMHALHSVGRLSSGQSFFLWGGSGALGTLAIQIAKQLGATVIATAGSDEKLERMRQLGADHVINRSSEDVAARVAEIFPDGIDLALDYVGPQTFNTTMGMLKKGGSMLLCGMLTGRETSFSIQQAYLKHISVSGLYLGSLDDLRHVMQWMADGRIRAVTDSIYPLEDGAEAQRRLESSSAFGKIVLRVD